MNQDELPILSQIAAELEQAWNAGDGEGFGRPFTEDADFVTIRGEHYRTREVIAQGHQGIFDSVFKGSVIRLDATSARTIAQAVLVGHLLGNLNVPAGPLTGKHASFATLVLVEREGAWQIAAFHNMVVQSPPAAT
jgi:uncharacterized protein (TIGR02246 family)